MKRNKIMALTALLTLLGAPSSKAQEVKGDSKQPTSAQSANKDSEAVDKTKEQNKNLDKTKDSKAPQQAKDSKTPQQKKEQTKDSNKNGKKDEKKQQTKDSNPSGAKSFVNRMMSLGYSMEWIKKNWPWLAAMGGTGVVSGIAGNKMGKNANVEAKVKQAVNAGYTKNEVVAEKVKQEINEKIASKELVKAADVDAKVQQSIDAKVTKGELFKKFDDDVIKELANNLGIKYTDGDLANEEFLNVHNLLTKNKSNALIAAAGNSVINSKVSSGELFTKDDVQNNYTKNKDVDAKVQQEIDKKINNKELVRANDQNAIKQAAEVLGIKHTDNELKQKINAAVLIAKNNDLLKRVVDENRKNTFDSSIDGIDEKLLNSLKAIQDKLNGNFADILVKTTYGNTNNEVKINNETIVGALSMLADIKNALVDKQALNFEAKFSNTEGQEGDKSWSDFYFDLGSKRYNVYIKHTDAQAIYVSYDKVKDRYKIALK